MLWEAEEIKYRQRMKNTMYRVRVIYRDNKLILTKKHTLWFRQKWKEIYHKLKQPELIHKTTY